jgi:hypothetical protein
MTSGKARRGLFAAVFLTLGSVDMVASAQGPATAQSPEGASRWQIDWLGYARRIPTAWSASRDTPRLEMALFPRPVTTAGGELALFSLGRGGWRWRSGFGGFIELDNTAKTASVNSGPLASSRGRILWRGSYSYYTSLELENAWLKISCSSCSAEVGLTYRHESEHATASNHAGDSVDYSTEPYVGDDVMVDVAFAHRGQSFYVQQRLLGMWFLPRRSSYSLGGAVDLHVRYTGWSRVQPFVSGYAERRLGTTLQGLEFPDAYRVRALLGVALPSSLGDIMVFGFGDVGHRYGVQALTEEATLGCGVRLALGRAWPP